MDFRNIQRGAKIVDTIVVEVERPTGTKKIKVLITGYQQPVVQIAPVPTTTEKQKRLFEQWAGAR